MTNVTDRQTDMLSQDRALHYSASRGKNSRSVVANDDSVDAGD